MASSRLALILATLVVRATLANAALVQRSRVTPLQKAAALLEDLRTKVNLEQEAEAKTYDNFACFCKDTTAMKLKAIEDGQAEKNALQAHLNQAGTDRDTEDAAIAKAVQDIADQEKELESLHAARRHEALEYEKSEVDLTGAVQALTAALHALKAAKTSTASLAQLQGGGQMGLVRRALLMAEVLSPGAEQKTAAALSALQQPFAIPDSQYEFHAGDIVSTLEGLKEEFKAKKDELDAAEVAAKQAYDKQMQNIQAVVSGHEATVVASKSNKAEKVSFIATTSQDLTTTAAQLLDDQAYVAELSKNCNAKAVLWDQRTTLRASELQALTQALQVLSSPAVSGTAVALLQVAAATKAMPALSSTTGQRTLVRSHLQHLQIRAGAPLNGGGVGRRARAAALLRTKAKELNSVELLRVASQTSEDPFAKVKQLIQELIERLLTEAQEEANHKGWCDGEVALAEQERETSATSIEEVNDRLAVGEARREKLAAAVQTLAKEIAEINGTLNTSTVLREQERAEAAVTIQEAQEAQKAVEEAITLLQQFYGTAANAELSLMQLGNSSSADDIPDAGFDSVYTGAQGAGGGVIAMLEVVAGDFARSVSDTEAAEKAAEADYYELQKASGVSLATKNTAKQEREAALSQADADDADDRAALGSHQSRLDKALTELEALQKACFDGGMSAEERKAKREEEIAALKAAMCILESGFENAASC